MYIYLFTLCLHVCILCMLIFTVMMALSATMAYSGNGIIDRPMMTNSLSADISTDDGIIDHPVTDS